MLKRFASSISFRDEQLPRRDALKILLSDISADADFGERFNRVAIYGIGVFLWSIATCACG